MTTVAYPSQASKAYFTYLDDTHGVLAKVDGEYLFMADDGALTVIEPEHFVRLMVLGQVGLAMVQMVLDQVHGGRAAIACSRRQEVA